MLAEEGDDVAGVVAGDAADAPSPVELVAEPPAVDVPEVLVEAEPPRLSVL